MLVKAIIAIATFVKLSVSSSELQLLKNVEVAKSGATVVCQYATYTRKALEPSSRVLDIENSNSRERINRGPTWLLSGIWRSHCYRRFEF